MGPRLRQPGLEIDKGVQRRRGGHDGLLGHDAGPIRLNEHTALALNDAAYGRVEHDTPTQPLGHSVRKLLEATKDVHALENEVQRLLDPTLAIAKPREVGQCVQK